MANNENLIPIPGRLHSVATEGHVSGANEIYDDSLQKDQATINQEVQEAIGSGGSVDTKIANAINALDSTKSQTAGADGLALSVTEVDGKITSVSGSIAANTYDANGAAAAAKSEVLGSGVGSDYNSLKKIEDKLSPIETAVGTGGSIDQRIEDATEDCAYLGENDGSSVIADFDPQTDTVWKKAQTLSNAEKAQVKTNLGLPNEVYSKTEVNELVSTPHQNYVTVSTYAELPASGSTDTIYRVSNYDGTQVAAGVYSEYAWSGSAYVFLDAKSSVGEVFDISEYHVGTKYANLAAALDSNNGGGVPQSLQKGGMSVKYVSNSDNKYVQYRLMATSFTTNVTWWQGVDEEPTAESNNLVKSGSVYTMEKFLYYCADDKGKQEIVSVKNPSFASGNRGYSYTEHLAVGDYSIIIEKPNDTNLSSIVLQIKKGDTTILYQDPIYYFNINNSNYAKFNLNITEENDYTIIIIHIGNPCTIASLIIKNIASPVIRSDYKEILFNSEKDQILLLNWYNATFDSVLNMVASTTRVVSDLITNYGNYQIKYDDVIYSLGLYTGTNLINIRNGETIYIDSSIAKQGFRLVKRDDSTISTEDIAKAKLTIKKVEIVPEAEGVQEIPISLEEGTISGAGDDVANTYSIRTQKINLSSEKLVLVICPENLYAQCNFENNIVSSRQNLSDRICGGVCIVNPKTMIRFAFTKKDSNGEALPASSITEEEKAQIKVYGLFKSKSSEYDILLAAPDSNEPNADFVCNNNNAQFIINSLASSIGNIHVGFAEGTFVFDKVLTTCWGKKTLIQTKGNVVGNDPQIQIRFTGKKGTNFVMTENAYNNLPISEESAFFTVPSIAKFPFAPVTSGVNLCFESISIHGYNYTKPLVILDFTWARESIINDFLVRSDYATEGPLVPFSTKPHDGCVGIRVGFGSNNGAGNYVKHGRVIYCGTGVSCCGEHYVFEDVLTHHCYIGWAFGDRITRSAFEHPNVMIGCSIEGCYRLMRLSKQGITIEGNFITDGSIFTWCEGLTTKTAIVAELESHLTDYPWLSQFIDALPATDTECVTAIKNNNFIRSTLVCIGLSTEEAWEIPLDERVEGQPTWQLTLPILEVLKGAYRGRIELDTSTTVFENGSGRAFTWRKYDQGNTILGHGNTVDETYG